jgi:hypothetical protein
VVKEIVNPEPKPAGNLIHHPASWMGSLRVMGDFYGRQSRSPSSKLDGVPTMRLNDYVRRLFSGGSGFLSQRQRLFSKPPGMWIFVAAVRLFPPVPLCCPFGYTAGMSGPSGARRPWFQDSLAGRFRARMSAKPAD